MKQTVKFLSTCEDKVLVTAGLKKHLNYVAEQRERDFPVVLSLYRKRKKLVFCTDANLERL